MKIFAWLGFPDTAVNNGKANIEMTQAQLDAAQAKIDALEAEKAEKDKVLQELNTLKETMEGNKLDVAAKEATIAELQAKIDALRNTPPNTPPKPDGTVPPTAPKAGPVFDPSKSMLENLDAVEARYAIESQYLNKK